MFCNERELRATRPSGMRARENMAPRVRDDTDGALDERPNKRPRQTTQANAGLALRDMNTQVGDPPRSSSSG